MKHNTIYKFYIWAGLSVVFFLSSCQKDCYSLNSSLKVSDFQSFGELHNMILANANENFNITDSLIQDENAKIDSLLKFNFDAIDNICLEDKEDIKNQLKRFKNVVLCDKFETFFGNNSPTREEEELFEENIIFEKLANDSVITLDELPSLRTLINSLHDKGHIDDISNEIYLTLLDLVEKSCAGLITDEELENSVDLLIYRYDNSNLTKDTPLYVSTGVALAVSKSSLEWWEENPTAITAESKIPQMVAMDIGGAIFGAVTNAATQAVLNKRWSWTTFGISVACGAVSGSLGMAGKIWKWLNGR